MQLDFISQNKRSIYGGVATFLFMGLGAFLLGNLSGYEAKVLIDTSLSGISMLCNTIVLGSATILALLLTLLGISSGVESKIKKVHYYQVLNIAKLDTLLFIGALLLFQFFNIPITESENLPTSWFAYIYWATLFFSSLLSGFMVTVILMLFTTFRNIINIMGFKKKDYLVDNDK
ncbi:MAG TPA: hypothetical protein DCX41_03100 [Aequorivita sp.]|nr:hypothetical protein [Aequorivita sp.]MBF31145.1 hypothetical protein [Aequorivita sp.]HAV53904.1 hypothetical protein [Aequorivita sp.]HBL79623.1 hypothetical protein [Aequorivita sp.]|tara:strand:+ start:2851 stop:3375 length:525 start_codon:yes stop_codon:yes gene_type:complete